jgi:ribonuclease HI
MFVGAKTVQMYPVMTVDIGEALDKLAAMELVQELAFDQVVFCLDSKKVVDAFNSDMQDDSELGSILANCRVF